MMQSNTTNYEPMDGSSSSSSTRIARTSLLLSLNGQSHDLSNLCWKTQHGESSQELYPTKKQARQLPEIDESHTLQLWEPLPRSEAPFRRCHTADEAMHMSSSDSYCPSPLPTHPAAPGPVSPCSSPFMAPITPPRPVSPVAPSPRPLDNSSRHGSRQSSRSSSPVPAPSSSSNNNRTLNQPGPRPKVDYKRLYNRGDPEGSSRRSLGLGSSQRHISFQEQQLQRTLEEERRLNDSDSEIEFDDMPAPQEPSYPMPSPVEPSYPMPFPFPDMEPQVEEEQPVYEYEPAAMPEKESYKKEKRDSFRYNPRHRSPSPPLPTCSAGSGSNSKTVMEIAPNMFVPYKGSHETWEAVQLGRFTVTTCFACALQLVVIDTAEFLVCPDCHTVSPLSYSDSSKIERCGVGLGIKREWCDTEGALVMEEQHQHNHVPQYQEPMNNGYYNDYEDMPSMQSYPDESDRFHQKAMKEEEKFSSSQHYHQPNRRSFMI